MKPFDPTSDTNHRRLILVGPPGTGKTRVALESFITPALLSHPEERILSCSFSNAAADELRERLALRLVVSQGRLRDTVSTIHSEALKRVRIADGALKLYDPICDAARPFTRATMPDELAPHAGKNLIEAAVLAWDRARSLLVHENERALQGLCAAFAARHGCTLRDVRAHIDYMTARKAELGALDFADMLLRALRLPPRSTGFALLLVDEAQDCTPLQWALIDHWSQAADRTVIIGDGDQCIHGWAGASYRQFVTRVRDPEWNARVLAQSWRVPLAPHGLARSIISRVSDREDAEYAPASREGAVGDVAWNDVTAEALAVAHEYATAPEHLTARGELAASATREMFILARTNRDVSRIRASLNQAGIPYADEAPGTPRSHAPASARTARTLIEMFQGKPVPAAAAAAALQHVPARGWFNGTKTKLLASLPEQGSISMADVPWFNPGSSITALLDAAGVTGGPNYWLRVAQAFGTWVLTDPPPIRVMTMHASKGREADVVAICTEKTLAVEFAGVDDDELRVLYVAVTRTRDKLLLFARPGYNVYEELYAETQAAPPF